MKKRPEEAPLNRACIEERLRDDENSSKGKIYEKVLKLNTVVEKVWKRHLSPEWPDKEKKRECLDAETRTAGSGFTAN